MRYREHRLHTVCLPIDWNIRLHKNVHGKFYEVITRICLHTCSARKQCHWFAFQCRWSSKTAQQHYVQSLHATAVRVCWETHVFTRMLISSTLSSDRTLLGSRLILKFDISPWAMGFPTGQLRTFSIFWHEIFFPWKGRLGNSQNQIFHLRGGYLRDFAYTCLLIEWCFQKTKTHVLEGVDVVQLLRQYDVQRRFMSVLAVIFNTCPNLQVCDISNFQIIMTFLIPENIKIQMTHL